ncbi:hypothetical protein FH972_004800 [Carpinus fangiana]|uniref:Uncharacterized protein n=1 Tax=Carpinus fangiana TaxID=176857 RepID=A0A5N6QQR8_9ROSI|nr:hypothetical protein FH972_004800 [Carpinus fangiana]
MVEMSCTEHDKRRGSSSSPIRLEGCWGCGAWSPWPLIPRVTRHCWIWWRIRPEIALICTTAYSCTTRGNRRCWRGWIWLSRP